MESLQEQKRALEDKIRRLEADLKAPLDVDLSEQALELSQQLMLRRLLVVERENLARVNRQLLSAAGAQAPDPK